MAKFVIDFPLTTSLLFHLEQELKYVYLMPNNNAVFNDEATMSLYNDAMKEIATESNVGCHETRYSCQEINSTR